MGQEGILAKAEEILAEPEEILAEQRKILSKQQPTPMRKVKYSLFINLKGNLVCLKK